MKFFTYRYFLVLILVVTVSNNAEAQENLPEIDKNAVIEADFPFLWIEQLKFAYGEYEKYNYDETCLIVTAGKEDGNIYINFGARKEPVVEGDEITITTGGNSNCGRAISYIFDENGKFVKWAYPR